MTLDLVVLNPLIALIADSHPLVPRLLNLVVASISSPSAFWDLSPFQQGGASGAGTPFTVVSSENIV
jgi:hypothetical protein